MPRTNQSPVPCSLRSLSIADDGGEDVATVNLGGQVTNVRLVRLWEVVVPSFRESVADVFQEVWPHRTGECVAIRRGTHGPDRKPTPLVLVTVDDLDPETETENPPRVLGYVIIYPSSFITRPEKSQKTGEAKNCTLNSVLVPKELRGAGVGAALVKLASRYAVTKLQFECVTAWCQPRLVKFYTQCGFQYEPPKNKNISTGINKNALWAKLLKRGGGDGDGDEGGDDVGDGDKESKASKAPKASKDSSSDSSDDELDECMRMFVETGDDLPKPKAM